MNQATHKRYAYWSLEPLRQLVLETVSAENHFELANSIEDDGMDRNLLIALIECKGNYRKEQALIGEVEA